MDSDFAYLIPFHWWRKQRAGYRRMAVALRNIIKRSAKNKLFRTFHITASSLKDFNEKEGIISSKTLAATTNEEDKYFKVTEKSILEITKQDIGYFHKFSKSDINTNFPEGFGKRILEALEVVGEEVLIREPAIDIIEILREWPASSSKLSAILLDGKRGSGKSLILNQVVNFARQSGWIVLFIPFGRKWCWEGHYLEPSKCIKSKFDIENLSVELLKQFLKAHSKELATIQAVGNYEGKYSKKKEISLHHLVEYGIKEPEMAGTVLLDLRNELSQITKFPVLIAIDEYNSWFGKTAFQYRNIPVVADDISTIHVFKDIDQNGFRTERKMANGLFLCANSGYYSEISPFPENSKCKAFIKQIPVYSNEEIKKIFALYTKKGYADFGMPSNISYVKLMTGANPDKIYRTAFDFFVPESNSEDFDYDLLLP